MNNINRLRIISFIAMCVLYLSSSEKTTSGNEVFTLDPYTIKDRGDHSKKKGFIRIHAHAWIPQKRKMYGDSDD